MYLEQINKANDVKQLDADCLMPLAAEIREFLIDRLSETGGHLASNLGVVELTIALHRCLDFPKDKLIWDVGHQSYTHKLLTGRREEFATLRSFGGISGFPKRAESDCDSFDTGHSSTSISAGLGFAYARDLSGGDERIVSVIGDGALTGGLAFEAINNLASLKKNFVVILNDNNIIQSLISKNNKIFIYSYDPSTLILFKNYKIYELEEVNFGKDTKTTIEGNVIEFRQSIGCKNTIENTKKYLK